MKRVLVAVGWVLLFTLLGAVGLAGVSAGLLAHPLGKRAVEAIALAMALGGGTALLGALGLLLFDRLPGVPVWPQPGAGLGLGAGLWGMAGFFLAMMAGGAGAVLVIVDAGFVRLLAHGGGVPDLGGVGLIATAALGGEASAGLWLAWVLRRLGAGAVAAGWCPALPAAYREAAAFALPIVLVVGLIARLAPPNAHKLDQLDMAKLMHGPVALQVAMMAVILLVAPVLEEIAFRGIGLGGIKARLGPGWAVVITSFVFVGLHAGEKLSYLPGFIDVGLLALGACLLRLRHDSVRPGILLHILYNLGGAVVAGLMT
jgi:membrane protease YdiL (CAAX protease family)